MNLFRQPTPPPSPAAPTRLGRVPWVLHDPAIGRPAILKLPGEPGRYHVLVELYASFSRQHLPGLLTILRGGEHPIRQYVHTQRDFEFGAGIWVPPGQPLVIGLAPRGSAQAGDEVTLLAIGYSDDSEE